MAVSEDLSQLRSKITEESPAALHPYTPPGNQQEEDTPGQITLLRALHTRGILFSALRDTTG